MCFFRIKSSDEHEWANMWPRDYSSSNFYTQSDVQYVIIYRSGEFYMSWFVASN